MAPRCGRGTAAAVRQCVPSPVATEEGQGGGQIIPLAPRRRYRFSERILLATW